MPKKKQIEKFEKRIALAVRKAYPASVRIWGFDIKQNERTLLPFSVEVHHSLMDGLHVGRYIARIEEMLAQPETFLD